MHEAFLMWPRKRLESSNKHQSVLVNETGSVVREGVVDSDPEMIAAFLLFPKSILRAEWEANAPMREALAIKRERLRTKREERKKR
jgi:hypothetical protein